MMKSDSLIHRFPNIGSEVSLPEKFTFPFCYTPAAITRTAADILMDKILSNNELSRIFSKGKMLGVLVIKDNDGIPGFLAGFSGLAGGRNDIPGFVPPVMDLTDPRGYFKVEERKISDINTLITKVSESEESADAHIALKRARDEKDCAVSEMKKKMKLSKARREKIRSETYDKDLLAQLIKESQFEKASLKRLAAAFDEKILKATEIVEKINSQIEALKKERAARSEALQRWIFENAVVENAAGERKSIAEIFADQGLVPPGGTGECAAPKLLHYAYSQGLEPVAMGEFWFCNHAGSFSYGNEDSEKAGYEAGKNVTRLHGRFYPSCTGKCGPLLGFMLKGLNVEENPLNKQNIKLEDIGILYEDDYLIAINKPSGLLSAPGKTGGKSALELLQEGGKTVFSVHRLDMDTSGVLVFAKNEEVCKALQQAFATRDVKKEYIAIVEGNPLLKIGQKGRISLPICPDYDDRPRQIVDFQNGKEAITDYEIIATERDCVRILFKPITGRTHQLRVHSAHIDGLASPIKGDRLYGSSQEKGTERLYLHSLSVSLSHPVSGEKIKISVLPDF